VLTTTEGIVLKTQKFAEADLIITHLTLHKGIIKTFAKSPLKTKSRFGSSLEPFTHAKITLLGKEQSMPKIVQSDILKPFHHLREKLADFICLSKIAEIIIALTPENIPTKKLFLFFLKILHITESLNQKQKNIFFVISLIHLLTILGYAPRLKGCGKCGVRSFDFYPGSGTTLCKKCVIAQPAKQMVTPIKITSNMIKFYSHSTLWSLHASTRLRPSEKVISTLSTLLEVHLNYILKKRLHTSEFLAKV
jgi:DNA repair protein RecO (recombination protein O)